jgi:hypothetical protein
MAERAAIVTGASRGIGLALTEVLVAEGYGVTLTARKPETLEQAADALRERGAEVEQVAANLTDEESVSAVVAHHRETFGRLDVLVNNAGVGIGARSTSTGPSTSTCSSASTSARSCSLAASAPICCAQQGPSIATRWWSTWLRWPARSGGLAERPVQRLDLEHRLEAGDLSGTPRTSPAVLLVERHRRGSAAPCTASRDPPRRRQSPGTRAPGSSV